jgi:hypothetical protein
LSSFLQEQGFSFFQTICLFQVNSSLIFHDFVQVAGYYDMLFFLVFLKKARNGFKARSSTLCCAIYVARRCFLLSVGSQNWSSRMRSSIYTYWSWKLHYLSSP